MQTTCEEQVWAVEEFGSAQLCDPRRVRRLVDMAAQVSRHPAGHVTAVFDKPSEREGAYRLLENPDIDAEALGQAAHQACAQRARGYPYVLAPTDGSSLHLSDPDEQKGFGSIGSRERGARGLKVLSVQAISPTGVPLGLLAQQYWARGGRSPKRRGHHDSRHTQDKETQQWLEAMYAARELLAQQAPDTPPWFQLDREGDAWAVYLFLQDQGCLYTIRAAHDRRILDPETGAKGYLWQAVRGGAVKGGYTMHVPAGPGRSEREAVMVVSATPVVLDLRDKRIDRHYKLPLYAVWTREVGSTPLGESPIEWLLLTNYPVDTLADGLLVIGGYAQRWRIEQFHKLWKSEACHVEDTQLRGIEPVCKWAIMLASVAVRIERMMYLSRNEPEQPAEVAFSQAEIEAVILLREPKGVSSKAHPTVGQVVRWVADLGGYTGKSSGGPPGTKVLTRGMLRIIDLADALSRGIVVANG
jgi:hypothetical protein